MPLSIIPLDVGKISDLQAAYNNALTWTTPEWRCSESLPALPTLERLTASVTAPNRAVMVAREGSQGQGLVIYRPDDGRMLWLVCHPTRFAEITEAFARAITNLTGQRAWGVIGRDGPLNTVVARGFTSPHPSKPQFGGRAIWLTP